MVSHLEKCNKDDDLINEKTGPECVLTSGIRQQTCDRLIILIMRERKIILSVY